MTRKELPMVRTIPSLPAHAWRAASLLAVCASFAAVPAVSTPAVKAGMAALAPINAMDAAHEPRPMDIGAARALPLGTVVTVEGSVTVPSGLLSSGGSLDQGFAIQDRTGGIYVSVATNLGLIL